MSDEPIKSCPQCGREVRRLIHGGTGVIFKGSGFYVTDKSKSHGTAPAKADKAAASSESSASSASPAASASADTAAKQEKPPPAEKSKSSAEPAREKAPAAGAANA